MRPFTSAILVTWPQINAFEFKTLRLEDVARPQCICIDVAFGVGMKEACLMAVEDRFHSGRIGQAKNAPSGSISSASMPSNGSLEHVLSLAWRTDNGNALRHHDLIATVSMQISATHKACLGGMGMDPA